MNFVNLVQFVIAWKQREQRNYFKEDAANAPIVHLVVVVAIGEQALRRPVPPGADVLCEGQLRVDPSARAEICKLDLVVFY